MTMDSQGNCIKTGLMIWQRQCAQSIVIPQGSTSAATPQGAFSPASSIHLGGIQLLPECSYRHVIPEWLCRGSTYNLWISPRGLSLLSAFTLPDETFGNDDRIKLVNKTKRRACLSGLTISLDMKWNDYQEPKVSHMDVVNIIGRKL